MSAWLSDAFIQHYLVLGVTHKQVLYPSCSNMVLGKQFFEGVACGGGGGGLQSKNTTFPLVTP